MGWSFRKSKSFGPFRFNFSKSGIGMSFGVKGARVSINSRGTYVSLGANGIYYRQRIGGNNPVNNNHLTPLPGTPSPSYFTETLHTITTEDVEQVTDVDSQEFIKELESKAIKTSYFAVFGIVPSMIIMLALLLFSLDQVAVETQYQKLFTVEKPSVHVRIGPSKDRNSIHKAKFGDQYEISTAIDSSGWVKIFLDSSHMKEGFIRADMGEVKGEIISENKITRIQRYPLLGGVLFLAAILVIFWCFYLVGIDKKRKTLEIHYTLDEELGKLHLKFLEVFKEFASSKKVWQKLHEHGVSDSKYHAGASQLVSRIDVLGIYNHKLPSSFLKTNASIPCISLKNTELYFFPERLILKRGNKFGAAFYKNIAVASENVRFVEEGTLPSDAVIVDHTWKYLNKSGGPDRRFNNNRQLPICYYTDYSFESDSGLHEEIITSKTGGMDKFCEFIKVIGNFQRNLN